MSNRNSDYYFLREGGEMGELIRAKDWSKTALGDPANWPQSLCTMVAVMLDNPFGMYIAWGSEYIQLYNDGYRPILGATKHPEALGISTRETFSEIWHIIESMFGGVMKGTAVGFPDFMLPLNRNGFVEECYFDFSYSPIRKDNGEVGGVLVTVIETTEKKRATEALKESNARFINNIMQAPVAMCIFRGKNYVVEIANEQMLKLWGKHADQVMNKPIFEGLPEAKDQGLEALLDSVFKTGEKFIANERPVNLPRNGKVETTYINFVYEALKEPDATITGVVAIATDVTSQVLARKTIEESDERLRSLIENAPFPIGVYAGKEMRIEVANESIIKAWGKGNDVKGKLFKELVPEVKSQKIFEQLDAVFATGVPFHAHNQYLKIVIDGKEQPYYYNYSFTPVFDSSGKVYGVMNTASDVTDLNLAKKKIEESESNLKLMIHQAPVSIGILRGLDYTVEIVNKHALELWGRTEQQVLGKSVFTSMPELLTQGIKELLDDVTITGKRFATAEMPVQLLRNGIMETVYVNFSYEPLYDADEKINGIMTVGMDVTHQVVARKKIEDSEKRYNLMLMQSPFAFLILKGKDMVVHLANESMKEVLGKGSDIEGKPLLAVLPELKGQAFPDLLDNVYTTGIPFSANEMLAKLTRNGKLEDVYFNYVYQPYYEADKTISGVAVIAYDVTSTVIANKKIEASEQRLNIVVEASELGTYELNLKTKEPTYSKRYLEILGGYKEDIKLTHAQLLKHLHPDDFSIREKAFKEAFITGHLHYEARLIWHDKSIHWMEGKGKVFYDEENQPVKLIGTIRDITEEKNHEDELKKSEEQFSTLADNMENLAWLADGEGWIYWYNKRWLEYTGLTLEEMQGWGWQKVHHPDHVERILEISKKIWHINETFELTFPLRRHDGEYRWFLTRGYPVTNEEGKIIRWIGTNTDINEQKKAEEQFKVLADQAPMWVWLTDKEVNILYTNPEVLKFLGIAHYTEFTGHLWEQKVHSEDIAIVYKSFGEAASLQQSFSFEFRVLNASKQQYEWFHIKAVPRLEAGEFTGFIGTGININEQKAFAKELEEQVVARTAELKASEEKFYTLFNLSPICKTLSDVGTGKIVMVNDAFTKLFGYSPEETLNKSSAEMGLLDLEARASMINELKANGKIVNKELGFIKKSGERFIALASAEVITMGDKQFVLSAFNDISEIKKAEQHIKKKNIELENKTIQLEEAQELAHIGSWEWDVVANKIEWSDELFRIFGLTPQEFKADYENYLKYIHPDDMEYVNSIIQLALKDHQPYSLFHKVACADGKVRILRATGKVITDGIGNVIRMSGTAQDVTEQKNYEEELKISEERFYKIFDSNPVPMSLSEIGNSKIKYANNRFYNAFGYSKEEVIGRSSEELNLLDPEESKRVVNLIFGYLLENRPLAEVQALSKEEKEALLLKLKQSEKMKDFEILYTRKNGEKFPALVSYEIIRIGFDSYTVTSYQDITERKKAEALLRSQNYQLEKMNKELESFAYISSHDLQEPLRKIQTFASRIKEKEENNLSESGKDMFNRMQDSAKRMQTLIQDLLSYSRTNTTEHKFETTDLNEIIAEVKEDLKEELKEKHATIEANQLCDADIIPFQFRQLMHNLIGNSLKFANPHAAPHIRIKGEIANGIALGNQKLAPQNKYCHITVSDNGIGFEQQYSEKIFEVFQRLHGKNEFNGTGIGLSIVKKIVENHNGIIIANGELNKGATFDIYIPAT